VKISSPTNNAVALPPAVSSPSVAPAAKPGSP
jgi:hypothetical protein